MVHNVLKEYSMKRRNFFSKIGKGLLGIGIVTALPTPEVEPTPEIAPDTSLDLSSSSNWKAMVISDDQFFSVEPQSEDTWVAFDLNGNRTPEHDIIFPTKKD